MRIYRPIATCILLIFPLGILTQDEISGAQNKKSKYVCSEPNPALACAASTTCGSASEPCSVDVKRTSYAASATPSLHGAKGNSTFCVRVGTTVIWKSDTKHQGFIVDMGPDSPFATDDIIGGSDKSVSVVAKTPGCYKYSVGACLSGAIYGMCGNSSAELVVVP